MSLSRNQKKMIDYLDFKMEMQKRDEWDKKHSILSNIRYALYKIINMEPISYIKGFIERGRYGIAKENSWNLYEYISEIMVRGIKLLREEKHSYPDEFENYEQWDKVLETMETEFRQFIKQEHLGKNIDTSQLGELITKYFTNLWD